MISKCPKPMPKNCNCSSCSLPFNHVEEIAGLGIDISTYWGGGRLQMDGGVDRPPAEIMILHDTGKWRLYPYTPPSALYDIVAALSHIDGYININPSDKQAR